MQNDIKFFYDIEPVEIRQLNGRYIFNADNRYYSLEKCTEYVLEMNKIYQTNKYMIYNGIPVYSILLNKQNEIITNINDLPYILLLIDDKWDEQITIDYILEYQFQINHNFDYDTLDWKKMWINKIDYFEYQLNQIGIQYPLIRESMAYFIGVAENAICILNDIKRPDVNYLQHRRIRENSSKYDFFNPLNIIIDTKIRDICEYYKSIYIKKGDIFSDEVVMNLRQLHCDDNETLNFYARMFFPTFYFDEYERIINNIDNEVKIESLLQNIDGYQKFLSILSFSISQYVQIPNVEWIKKI